MLKVKNLKASIGEVEILKGIDLEIGDGELHAVMGPNGSGKSTLCHVLMGNTDYKNEGAVTLNGEDVLSIPQFDRAQKGIFQSFQYPVGLPGVTLREFIQSF
ncbi:ATP-binding cassette domain-containing protein, partial [Acidimicrobiaceae bacterium]|nr:ATP-binding cassette domain-containing protein [Acidimicrobiaceae bacterium]